MDQSFPAYRFGVGLMLQNAQGHIFMAKRRELDLSHPWQMPQGGIDPHESPRIALMREMQEEIGTQAFHIQKETHDWMVYDFPPLLREKLWNGQYAGQKQMWYLARFTGTDQDINIETEHPEFCEWGWFSPAQILTSVVDFKRDLYQRLLEIFQINLSL